MRRWAHKYNAKRTIVDGQSFPSRLEADTYCHLKMLEKQGLIFDLRRQVTVELSEAKIRWKCDFSHMGANGEQIWSEAKGVYDNRFRVIMALWTTYGPGRLDIYHRAGKAGIMIAKVIVPEGMR